VFESVGIDEILSETEILVGALATAIEFENVRKSMVLGSADAIAFELTLKKGAWVVGKTVGEVAQAPGFPRSCVVAGMSFEGVIQAPRGASTFGAGMDLLLVTARADLAATIAFFMRRADD
jgi:trk system potassium uptake protein TrkA